MKIFCDEISGKKKIVVICERNIIRYFKEVVKRGFFGYGIVKRKIILKGVIKIREKIFKRIFVLKSQISDFIEFFGFLDFFENLIF